MSTNALREGFREIFRDPALLLIEVGWRWAFGTIAIVVCAVLVFVSTKSVRVNQFSSGLLSQINLWQTAQSVAAYVVALGAALIRAGLVSVFFLAFCWIVLSALGRRATLLRVGLGNGANLRVCFGISTLRAAIALGALFAWILAGLLAGVVAAAAAGSNSVPNIWLILLILAPVLVVIVALWSAANWYLSLAPLFPERTWTQAAASAWKLAQSRRDEVLEISVAIAAIRFVLFIAALALSLAVGAIITNPRVFALDFIAIALLYFFVADFVTIARLAAFAKLRDGQTQAAAPVALEEPIPHTPMESDSAGAGFSPETL